jgi:hypothetical protein
VRRSFAFLGFIFHLHPFVVASDFHFIPKRKFHPKIQSGDPGVPGRRTPKKK